MSSHLKFNMLNYTLLKKIERLKRLIGGSFLTEVPQIPMKVFIILNFSREHSKDLFINDFSCYKIVSVSYRSYE